MSNWKSIDFGADSYLSMLKKCDGYYQCPKDSDGRRLGPLVGYAGRYGDNMQYVGEDYYDFARAERYGSVLQFFADEIVKVAEVSHRRNLHGSVFCGAPEGGKALACALSRSAFGEYIYPEKKVIAPATRDSREITSLDFGRHEPEPGSCVWIVEDVCNNFSTTKEMVALIQSREARVEGILCFLNRSTQFDTEYDCDGLQLPVIALVRKPTPQYTQDDPFVALDIKRRNVVWKPKNKITKLIECMEHVGA